MARWVVVVTLFLWVWADIEFTDETELTATMQLVTTDKSSLVLKSDSRIQVRFTVQGRQRSLDQLKRRLASPEVVIQHAVARGEDSVSMRDILNAAWAGHLTREESNADAEAALRYSTASMLIVNGQIANQTGGDNIDQQYPELSELYQLLAEKRGKISPQALERLDQVGWLAPEDPQADLLRAACYLHLDWPERWRAALASARQHDAAASQLFESTQSSARVGSRRRSVPWVRSKANRAEMPSMGMNTHVTSCPADVWAAAS